MKRLFSPFLLSLVFILGVGLSAAGLSGCTTTGTPAQQYINTVYAATVGIDQITKLATSAMQTNLLKGQDADNVIAAIQTAKGALAATQLIATSSPATAAAQVTAAMAQLTATPLVAKLLTASPPTSAASAAGAKP